MKKYPFSTKYNINKEDVLWFRTRSLGGPVQNSAYLNVQDGAFITFADTVPVVR